MNPGGESGPENPGLTSRRGVLRIGRAQRAGVNLLLLATVGASVAALVGLARRWEAPMRAAVEIDLSPWALPGYTLFSLSRGLAAYFLSLLFTIVVGTAAAHSKRAERVLIPLLDIGQGIPVLGFLPGLVLGMVALFPKSNVGLELACILMIFTGQVWNMAFSYYGSVRGVPTELGEVARIHRFSWGRRFRTVELSSAVIGLVWNSMMSMAGGWFFLTVNEAFTLGAHDFRLPGIGSYMAVAIERDDRTAMAWALVAMTVMIVAVDQLLWRPLVAWSQRFRTEEVSGERAPSSWVLDLLRRSTLLRRARRALRAASEGRAERNPEAASTTAPDAGAAAMRSVIGWLVGAAAVLASAVGALAVLRLLLRVTPAEWRLVGAGLGATALRTAAALALALLWTLPAGILIGRRPALSRRLQPVIQIVASFPAPMIFPLVTGGLLALRVPFAAIAAVLMLLGAQWYILFNVLAGASAIPGDLDEVARVSGLSGAATWRVLLVPGVFPFLVTGLVTAAGGAWNASIVAETLTYRGKTLETFGLGSLITRATQEANFPLLAAGVLTMSMALVLLNRTVWRRLWTLAATKYSLNR